MTKKLIISVLASITCLMGYHSFSQQLKKETKPDQYRAVHWTKENKLASNISNTMIKDVNGFLWIGSSETPETELCRFDGSVFKKYFPEQLKRGTINSGIIYSFKEDSLHNIWIGTGKGLSRYDSKADTFTNIVTVIDSINPDGSVRSFWATSNYVYSVESGWRIVAYNIHSLTKKTLLTLTDSEKKRINGLRLNYIILDTISNCLWMPDGYSRNPERGGLLSISLKDGERKQYTWPCYSNNITHRHTAEAIRLDHKRNSIWINSGDGLLEFTLADKQFHHIDALNEFVKFKDYDRGVGIDIDRNGRVWFSTYSNGIFIYDPETDHLKQAFSDPHLQKEAGDANLHIYCDREGIVWTSNWFRYGIYEIIPHNPPVKRYASNPNSKDSLSSGLITTIVQGPQGKLWLGTADGINIFDPATETFEVLREKDLPGIEGTAIIPLYIDTLRQKAWVNAGSQETDQQYFGMQMYEMDLKTRKCRRILFRDGSKQIDSFRVAHALVRPYKNGIIFCDELHGVFELKEGSLVANLSIALIPGSGGFAEIAIIGDQYLFLSGGGVFENKNGKWIKTPHRLDSLEYYSIYYDKKDETFWVSHQNKLVHYDKEFREIISYGEADGYNEPFINMEFDNEGNLWFINDPGELGRFNPAAGNFTIFSETDGYYKRDYVWFAPVTKDASGNLYTGIGLWRPGGAGTDWGFDRIYPERYTANNTTAVYLQSLSINQKPFPLSVGVNSLEELQLRYDQKLIRIETGTINFYTKGRGNIRYKLEKNGETGEWLYPPDYTIRLEDLSPASYRLVVQASNASKEFTGPEKTLLIHISPPFWETWWFRITAVLLVLGIFYMVVRYRTQQKFRVQLERLETERQMAEMRQKTAELQQQKTEMEMQALRAQMNPHFIFNSLNSINRFILQNNRLQASEYLTKFSKLVRMILQNSQASLITLESELEALGLYLEMEALRFNYHFDYKISVPKDLDIEVMKVPPLIIQPYVENAIWHGLMHREEKGQLDVEVSQEDDHLYFKVTDNGIGRKRASELASKSATKHKSMGLRITAHRIAMMQNANGSESPVTINDLVTPDGMAAGTEVIIKMPLVYD